MKIRGIWAVDGDAKEEEFIIKERKKKMQKKSGKIIERETKCWMDKWAINFIWFYANTRTTNWLKVFYFSQSVRVENWIESHCPAVSQIIFSSL